MNIFNLYEITKFYLSPSSYFKSKIFTYNNLNYIYDNTKIYIDIYKRQQKRNKIKPIELSDFKIIEHV